MTFGQRSEWKPRPLLDDIATVLPLFDGASKNPAHFTDPAPLAEAMQDLGAVEQPCAR